MPFVAHASQAVLSRCALGNSFLTFFVGEPKLVAHCPCAQVLKWSKGTNFSPQAGKSLRQKRNGTLTVVMCTADLVGRAENNAWLTSADVANGHVKLYTSCLNECLVSCQATVGGHDCTINRLWHLGGDKQVNVAVPGLRARSIRLAVENCNA